MTRRLIPTVVAAAVVAAAITAPAALARPEPRAPAAKPAAVAVTTGSRHAIAVAGAHRFAVRPVLDRPSSPGGAPVAARPVTVSVTRPDRGIDWATIAIGIAGSLVAVGLLAGIVARTRRTHRPHIAA